MFRIDENKQGMPEIISEDTFMTLLMMQDDDDSLPTDIYDEGWEDDDLEDDGLMIGWSKLEFF